jgi:N-acetylglucosaminyl-diphospho-decaprenol L-rhamnosyltransferase
LRDSECLEAAVVSNANSAEVAVLIVGFHNAEDIAHCIAALAHVNGPPNFDVFICENGGRSSYEELVGHLTDGSGGCGLQDAPSDHGAAMMGQFVAMRSLSFSSRPSKVLVGCAADNLGYAGGINAWLRELVLMDGWKGVWILNPDTEPEADALAALVARAELGGKGMVGSTILEAGRDDLVRFRGGLHWQRFAARGIAIGLNEQINAPFDLSAVESAMDSPSGASMYVTRPCLEQIGLMDESYFLFFEDLDWGVRAKKLGLGYASSSIVAHQRGTTTGSAGGLAGMSKLAVYLQHRNGIHFVRRHFPWSLPVRIAVSILYAFRFLLNRAPGNFRATLEGVLAGLRGETGQPTWHRKPL